MRQILYISVLVILVAILPACSDFLDNKPKGYTIPEKLEDYEKLLSSQKLMSVLDDDMVAYFTDDIKLLEANTGADGRNYIGKKDAVKNIFSFKPGQVFLPGGKDVVWNGAYNRLFTYNIVVNEVMNAKDGEESAKLALRAEALFGRAFEYLYLVNLYGKHYDAATAATDYGVPYLKEGNINQKYHRHTVKEVYDFILEDLKEAEPYLKDKVANRNHPTKASLNSLYARIYLYMGDYNKCLEYANKALAVNSNLINLNDYEKREGFTFGRVHLKGNTGKYLPDVYSPEANYIRYADGSPQTSVMLSDNLRDIFKKDLQDGATDLRKEFFTAEDEVDMGRLDKFPGECAYVLYLEKQAGLTSVDDLLMAAECEARVGSKERAMELINKLRDNRIENNIHLTAATNDEALVKVLEERRRELMIIGAYRYIDLKRLNKEARFAKTVTHTVDGNTWTLAPNSPLYILPVSDEVLTFYKDMPQYDRK